MACCRDQRVVTASRLFVGGAHTLALMHFEDIGQGPRDLFIRQMVGGTLAALVVTNA